MVERDEGSQNRSPDQYEDMKTDGLAIPLSPVVLWQAAHLYQRPSSLPRSNCTLLFRIPLGKLFMHVERREGWPDPICATLPN